MKITTKFNDSAPVARLSFLEMAKTPGIYIPVPEPVPESEAVRSTRVIVTDRKEAFIVYSGGCEVLNDGAWSEAQFEPTQETVTIIFTP